ncbi:hypothetical protein ACTFIV_004527 [Dictyostelium citrinum]
MKNKFYFLFYFILSIIFTIIKSNQAVSFYGTSKDKYYQIEYYDNKECEGDPIQYQSILLGTEYCFAIPNFQLDCTGGFENSTKECYYSYGCYCGESCRQYINLNECVIDGTLSFRIVYQIINYKENDFCIFTETHSVDPLSDERVIRYRLNGLQAYKKGYCMYYGNVDCDLDRIYFYFCNSTGLSLILLRNFTNDAISFTDPIDNFIGQHYFFPNDANFLIKPIANSSFKPTTYNYLFSISIILIFLFIL